MRLDRCGVYVHEARQVWGCTYMRLDRCRCRAEQSYGVHTVQTPTSRRIYA